MRRFLSSCLRVSSTLDLKMCSHAYSFSSLIPLSSSLVFFSLSPVYSCNTHHHSIQCLTAIVTQSRLYTVFKSYNKQGLKTRVPTEHFRFFLFYLSYLLHSDSIYTSKWQINISKLLTSVLFCARESRVATKYCRGAKTVMTVAPIRALTPSR